MNPTDPPHVDPADAERAWQLAAWERFAPVYDELSPPVADTEDIAFCARLAPPGAAVLDLGAGTGRVAIPLQIMGNDVTAVDLSPAMLDVLRARDAGPTTVVADMCELRLDKTDFDVVLCLCNTLCYATSTQDQRQVLGTIRHHLAPTGVAVVHNGSPCSLVRDWAAGPKIVPIMLEDGSLALTAGQLHMSEQRFDTVRTYTHDGVESRHMLRERYVWPAELAAMAELEGLDVTHVYGDWHRGPFTETSPFLITLLQPAGTSSSDYR